MQPSHVGEEVGRALVMGLPTKRSALATVLTEPTAPAPPPKAGFKQVSCHGHAQNDVQPCCSMAGWSKPWAFSNPIATTWRKCGKQPELEKTPRLCSLRRQHYEQVEEPKPKKQGQLYRNAVLV